MDGGFQAEQTNSRVQGPRMSCRADKCSAISHGTGMNWAPTMMHGFCSAERERLAQALFPQTFWAPQAKPVLRDKKESIKVLTQEWCNLSGVWGPFILLRVKHDLEMRETGRKEGSGERQKRGRKNGKKLMRSSKLDLTPWGQVGFWTTPVLCLSHSPVYSST